MSTSRTLNGDEVMKVWRLGSSGAVLGIFIWVGQSKAKQSLGRPTEVVYVGIMGMTRAVWVGQDRIWVGHGSLGRPRPTRPNS